MRILLLLFICLLFVIVLAAHWRGYHDGIRAQAWTPAANTDADGLDTLLREIAANHWHGLADDALLFQPEQLHAVFLTRKLSAQCLAISDYGVWRLQQAGYRARNVGLMNLHPETYNGFADGHRVLEVWHPRYGQWVVVDFLFNRMYAQTALSFVQARSTPIMLADDPYSNPADFAEQLHEPETWALGYGRTAQLAFIEGGEGGVWWHGSVEADAVASVYGGGGIRYRAEFLAWAYGA